MFDDGEPLHLHALSPFHLFLPPLIIGMLIVEGYDQRAFRAQTVLAWVVILLSFLLTAPEDNINWVHGIGAEGDDILPPWLDVPLYTALLPLLVLLPSHRPLIRLFSRERPSQAERRSAP